MVKKAILAIIAVLFCGTLFSQQSDDGIIIPDIPKSYNLSIGPKIGLGLVSGTKTSNNYKFQSGFDLQLGASSILHFGHRFDSSPSGTGLFGLKMELLYEYRMPNTDFGTINMHCVEIPVLWQYYPISSLASEFAIEAGVTIVKTLKCSPEQMQLNNIIYHVGQLSSADVMVSLGLSYRTPYKVSFDARYNIGTSPLAGNLDSKLSTITVSAVYLLDF